MPKRSVITAITRQGKPPARYRKMQVWLRPGLWSFLAHKKIAKHFTSAELIEDMAVRAYGYSAPQSQGAAPASAEVS